MNLVQALTLIIKIFGDILLPIIVEMINDAQIKIL